MRGANKDMQKAEAFVRKVLALFPGHEYSEETIRTAAAKVAKAFPPAENKDSEHVQ